MKRQKPKRKKLFCFSIEVVQKKVYEVIAENKKDALGTVQTLINEPDSVITDSGSPKVINSFEIREVL